MANSPVGLWRHYPIESGVVTVDIAGHSFAGKIVVTLTSETSGTASMTMRHVDPASPCNGREFTGQP